MYQLKGQLKITMLFYIRIKWYDDFLHNFSKIFAFFFVVFNYKRVMCDNLIVSASLLRITM